MEGIVTFNNADNRYVSENVTSYPDQWPPGTDYPVSELSMQKMKHKHILSVEPHVKAEVQQICKARVL